MEGKIETTNSKKFYIPTLRAYDLIGSPVYSPDPNTTQIINANEVQKKAIFVKEITFKDFLEFAKSKIINYAINEEIGYVGIMSNTEVYKMKLSEFNKIKKSRFIDFRINNIKHNNNIFEIFGGYLNDLRYINNTIIDLYNQTNWLMAACGGYPFSGDYGITALAIDELYFDENHKFIDDFLPVNKNKLEIKYLNNFINNASYFDPYANSNKYEGFYGRNNIGILVDIDMLHINRRLSRIKIKINRDSIGNYTFVKYNACAIDKSLCADNIMYNIMDAAYFIYSRDLNICDLCDILSHACTKKMIGEECVLSQLADRLINIYSKKPGSNIQLQQNNKPFYFAIENNTIHFSISSIRNSNLNIINVPSSKMIAECWASIGKNAILIDGYFYTNASNAVYIIPENINANVSFEINNGFLVLKYGKCYLRLSICGYTMDKLEKLLLSFNTLSKEQIATLLLEHNFKNN